MISKVTHLSLLVKDQNEALRFYKDKLGLKIHTDASFGEMRWLTLCPPEQPDFEIALMQAGPNEMALVGKQAGPYPLFNFETKDCKSTYHQLKASGVTFDGEPSEESWGTGVVMRDLYGNMIYLNESK